MFGDHVHHHCGGVQQPYSGAFRRFAGDIVCAEALLVFGAGGMGVGGRGLEGLGNDGYKPSTSMSFYSLLVLTNFAVCSKFHTQRERGLKHATLK